MKRFALRFAGLSPYLFCLFYLIIGFMTPGYSHISHTISRLSLGKYGYLESLNILQFSVGLFIMIYAARHQSKNSRTIRQISYMLSGIALTITLLAIFPTDPIDSFPTNLHAISWNAIMHFGVVGIFTLFTPISVVSLYTAFQSDSSYASLAKTTLACGIITFILSVFWFIFFYLGIMNAYRGVFQKIIALVVIYWVTSIMKRITTLIPHDAIASREE